MVRTSNGDSLTSWFPNGDSLTSILFPVFLDVCWCLAGCPSAWITSGVKRRFKNAWAICTNIDPKPSATKSCTESWRLEVLGWKPPTGLVYDMLTSTWYVWVCAELQASAVKRQGIMWGLYRAFNWVTGHGFFHPQVDRSSNEVKKNPHPTETSNSKLSVLHRFHLFVSFRCVSTVNSWISWNNSIFLHPLVTIFSFLQDSSQSTLLHLGESEANTWTKIQKNRMW